MFAIINKQRIPDETLSFVLLSIGGGVHISGEAIDVQQRVELDSVLSSLHQGDTVEFDVEDRDFRKFHGAGTINNIERMEQPVGTLVRIRYSVAIQYIH